MQDTAELKVKGLSQPWQLGSAEIQTQNLLTCDAKPQLPIQPRSEYITVKSIVIYFYSD